MKNCPECGNIILGRVDKKFCSDMCRNNFNNKLKAVDVNYVRNINNSLKKNRRILEEICPEEKSKTTRNTLNDKGFDFNHVTHLRKTQKGSVYHFVYDYGYLELDNDFFLIVKDNRSKD
jgi:DNA-directed RNA polymerase subunit M/transcription elongation factor TFIIS